MSARLLADYSSDAVLFTPTGPLKGPDAIKPLFQALVSEFLKPGSSFTVQQRCIEGDHAYILWTAETQTIRTNLLPTHLLSGAGK